MRVLSCAVLIAALAPAAQAADVWAAECSGQNQVQYQQTIGGEGYLHAPQGDGTFKTVKLKQSYYDGNVVCGSTTAKAADNEIAAVCADNKNQTINVENGAQLAKGMRPEAAPVYCQAQITTIK